MRILHVIPSLSPAAGGPPRVAACLACAQTSLGHEVSIATFGQDGQSDLLGGLGIQELGNLKILIFSEASLGGLLMRGAEASAFDALVRRQDVLHAHGVWEFFLHRALGLARKHGKISVITPHGMVSHYGMRKKAAKKRIAMRAYARRALESAHFVQALSATESAEIAHYAPRANIHLVPNGVIAEDFCAAPARSVLGQIVEGLTDAPYVLFLARIDHMKGVDVLIDAFARALIAVPALRLVIAGPDYGAQASSWRRAIELGVEKSVHFVGMVSGIYKQALLAHATCLAQPSRHEGFSLSLLEALASGTPLVVSNHVDVPGLEESGAGAIAPLEPEAIAQAILTFARGQESCETLAMCARRLIRDRYTWEGIARQLTSGYERYLTEGSVAPAAECRRAAS